MSLLDRIRRDAARHDLWRRDTCVVAAVSGGSDSVAMLRLLHDLHAAGEMCLVAVAHLNHGIRAEAGDDEAFCAELASALGLPFVSARVDVPSLARSRRQSLEVAGRIARRAFLDQVRADRGADSIATAHTADDQSETVLLRVLRGTGVQGLSGIAPSAGVRIRPVLCLTRTELQGELRHRLQGWREDETNRDLGNPRNRIRHELLPYLEAQFNPSARAALVRLADAARADERLLNRLAATAAISVQDLDGDTVRLDAQACLALPDALSRRVVGHAILRVGCAPSADAVMAVLDVAQGHRTRADLAGLSVEHFRGFVVLVPRRGTSRPAPFRFELEVPGAVQVETAGWILEASGPFGQPQPSSMSADVAQIDADAAGRRLIVRSRRPGDRLRPLGLGGTKKVQDVFVDRKVNRLERDAVPIVTDAGGRIAWVAGHVVGEEFRVTEGTKAVIILKLRPIEPPR